jgi:hypothetical protein
MRKIISLVLMMFLLLSAVGFAFAQESGPGSSSEDFNSQNSDILLNGDSEDESSSPENPESFQIEDGFIPNSDDANTQLDVEDSIPDAEDIGFFRDRIDRIALWFTFDKEKRIERALEKAERRLAIAESIALENPEKAEIARERYEYFISKAESALENLDESPVNADGSQKEISKIVRAQNRFEKHRAMADAIHERALEHLENSETSPEKIERFKMFHERAIDRIDMSEEKWLEKREAAVLRHKVIADISDEELEAMVGDIEKSEGLQKFREMRKERDRVTKEEPARVHRAILVPA